MCEAEYETNYTLIRILLIIKNLIQNVKKKNYETESIYIGLYCSQREAVGLRNILCRFLASAQHFYRLQKCGYKKIILPCAYIGLTSSCARVLVIVSICHPNDVQMPFHHFSSDNSPEQPLFNLPYQSRLQLPLSLHHYYRYLSLCLLVSSLPVTLLQFLLHSKCYII